MSTSNLLRFVHERLLEGGWTMIRNKNHGIWQHPNGATFTSVTTGTEGKRHRANILATIVALESGRSRNVSVAAANGCATDGCVPAQEPELAPPWYAWMRSVRDSHGLSPAALAELLGPAATLSENDIRRMEAGKFLPTSACLERWLEVFSVDRSRMPVTVPTSAPIRVASTEVPLLSRIAAAVVAAGPVVVALEPKSAMAPQTPVAEAPTRRKPSVRGELGPTQRLLDTLRAHPGRTFTPSEALTLAGVPTTGNTNILANLATRGIIRKAGHGAYVLDPPAPPAEVGPRAPKNVFVTERRLQEVAQATRPSVTPPVQPAVPDRPDALTRLLAAPANAAAVSVPKALPQAVAPKPQRVRTEVTVEPAVPACAIPPRQEAAASLTDRERLVGMARALLSDPRITGADAACLVAAMRDQAIRAFMGGLPAA